MEAIPQSTAVRAVDREKTMKLAGVKLAAAIAGAIASILVASAAIAQDYPTRPITWVVPFPPGGITDNMARTVAKVLSDNIGQPVIIENKPGAGGIVGTEYVVNAKPDGYTFLYASNGALVTYQFLYKKLSYDPQTSLTPVHGLADSPMLMMVRADAPYKTLAEFIDYAKKNPDKLNYFSVGQGSTQHLATELLLKEAGIKMAHIPYKGSAPGLTDLLGGVIEVMFDYAVIMKPQIEAGKLRALAVTSDKRLANMPDVPTFGEQGYPGVVFTAWATIVFPAGVPQPIVDKLAGAFGKTLEDPGVIKYLQDQGAGIMQGVAKQKLTDFLAREKVKMKDIVERAGIQPE
jgi:tripartite-type tricarboxylate transporter receptor subunit TctC